MSQEAILWIVFNAVVAAVLYIDLFVLNRKSHVVKFREALGWYTVWVSLALLFGLGIFFLVSKEKALQFFTGYLIEQSLSVDNMFVFIMIFSYFQIAPEHQPRVLKWGILGAVVMRFGMILVGTALVRRFDWVLYIFGAFLIYTAYKMAFGKNEGFDPNTNPLFRLIKRLIPVTGFHGDKFFVKIDGVRHATTLFMALVVVELSDLVFAVDSIPAIFAITTDTFIVYTSNVFAILGLRALYFLLSGLVLLFAYLKYGVALILAFVGVKMLIAHYYHVPTAVSLGVIIVVLALSVAVSAALKPKAELPEAKA